MNPSEQNKFISGITSLLLLLFVALGCEKIESTSQNDSFSSRANSTPQNRQSKTADPLSAPTNATEITGKVVGVSDGDTITVLDNKRQYKIRLRGIDSPESGQPFGQAAKQNLSNLIFGKTVKVLIYKKDRYNRDLGTVFLDGKDINLEQIKAGYAWHYKKYQSEQSEIEREEYSTAETSARTGRISLWRDANPIAPEDWRSGKRNDTAKGKTNTNLSPGAADSTDNKDLTVYVTRTGRKYHRAGCRYLSRSQILISLKEARAGYDACSVCKPPN